MSTSLLHLRAQNQAKESADRTQEERRRNVLVLMIDYLARNGYIESSQRLQGESGVSQGKWEVADNMDLMQIMQQFEEYYEFKFQKKPVFTRASSGTAKAADGKKEKRASLPTVPGAAAPPMPPNSSLSSTSMPSGRDLANTYGGTIANFINNAGGGGGGGLSSAAGPGISSDSGASSSSAGPGTVRRHSSASASSGAAQPPANPSQQSQSQKGRGGNGLHSSSAPSTGRDTQPSLAPFDAGITGQNLASIAAAAALQQQQQQQQQHGAHARRPLDADHDFHVNRLLKPLPFFGDNAEYRELASMITRDIFQENPNVRWTDIAELDEAKLLLQEAIVLPAKYPQIFSGLLSPWKGVLLFGPPGTGKTTLAKAVATECKTTFFNISASSIVSKWRGDSEKLVRVLFELARYHAPSTIFLDEIDSIMGSRDTGGDGGGGGGSGQHEGSRRMKTELLIQMDGLSKTNDLVFVMAASNLPWDLDAAMLRRLEKRILVPLPSPAAREAIVRKLLPDGERSAGLDHARIAAQTENFSGADIELLCKEAAMRPVRRILRKLTAAPDGVLAREDLVLPLVTPNDMNKALSVTHPSTSAAAADKFVRYAAQFGSGVTTDLDDDDDGDGGNANGDGQSTQSHRARQPARGNHPAQQRASAHRGAASASSFGPAAGRDHDAMLDMYEQPSAPHAHAAALAK